MKVNELIDNAGGALRGHERLFMNASALADRPGLKARACRTKPTEGAEPHWRHPGISVNDR